MLKLLNPWAILAVVLAIVGAGGYGVHLGQSIERAKQAEQLSIRETIQQSLAQAVSEIKVTNTTTRQTIYAKTIEKEVYRECRNDPAVVGLLNDILAGKVAKPTRDLVVPAPDTSH